jgi:hypothetical protein
MLNKSYYLTDIAFLSRLLDKKKETITALRASFCLLLQVVHSELFTKRLFHPVCVEYSFFINTLVRMCSKIVALCL